MNVWSLLLALLWVTAAATDGHAQNQDVKTAFKEAQEHFKAQRYEQCLSALDRTDKAYLSTSKDTILPRTSILLRVQTLDRFLSRTASKDRERQRVEEVVRYCNIYLNDDDNAVLSFATEANEVRGLLAKWEPILASMPYIPPPLSAEELAALSLQKAQLEEEERSKAEIQQRQRMLELEIALETNDPMRTKELLPHLDPLTKPLPSGKTAVLVCIRYDALEAFQAIEQFSALADKGLNMTNDATRNYLLTEAIQQDAPLISGYLMSGRSAERVMVDAMGTSSPLELVLRANSSKVLVALYRNGLDLRSWEIRIQKDPQLLNELSEQLLEAAFDERDAVLLDRHIALGRTQEELSALVFRCIEEGTPAMLERVLASAPGRSTNKQGRSYLHRALELDKDDMALTLLRNNYSSEVLDPEGCPPGHYIITKPLINVLSNDSLIAALDLDQPDADGFSIVHKLIFRQPKEESADLLRSLLERNTGININSLSNYGWTALHYAAREGRKDMVDVLVGNKADVAIYDPLGRTPKHVAKELGYNHVLSSLR